MKKIKKAIIPVAGNGTRFLPFTKSVPKEMLPIINKPAIDYIVNEAVESGIDEIIFITSSSKKSLEDYFDRNFELERNLKLKEKENLIKEIIDPAHKAKFYWIRQNEAKGLGHAVSLAASLIEKDETFALLLGDDVISNDKEKQISATSSLIEIYNKTGLSVLGVKEVDKKEIPNYGIIKPETEIYKDTWKISSVIEKPNIDDAPSNKAVVGRYILHAKIFDYLKDAKVDKKTKEIQITDSILKLADDRGVVARLLDGERYDMGSVMGFLKAQISFGLKREDTKKDLEKFIKNLKL